MAMKENVSFKEKERELYNYAMERGKLSFSIYVKELILKDMLETKENKEEVKVPVVGTKNKSGISLDF